MKKIVLTLAVLAGFAVQALAYDFCVDGIYYNVGYFAGEPEAWVTHGVDYGSYEGDIVIPEAVTYEGFTYVVTAIDTDAFSDCAGLTSFTIPQSVKRIDARAFYACSALHDIHIPDWVLRVHNTAFIYTGWYDDQPDGQFLYLDGWCLGYKGPMSLQEISIEEGTKAVADAAFAGIESLISVTLPNTLVSLGYYVFNYCINLRHVDFGESLEEIMYEAFNMCTSLDTVVLPETVTRIERNAFANCDGLTHLILPNSITFIGSHAFEGCRSLASVTLPNNLTEIEDAVFEYSGLRSITIPLGVTRIGDGAFYNESLVSATLSETVMEIGRHSFGSPSLDTVICLGTTPASLDNSPSSFEVPNDAHLIVPCGRIEIYSNSAWGEVFNNISDDCGEPMPFNASEWYYEIINENGSVTYQHLEYASDTTVNHKEVVVIIRTNTLYDKDSFAEATQEYVYEEDSVVYWWNNDLLEFTVLYDLGAQEGDSWVIKVGTETITMHVDAVENIEYDGRVFRMLRVSDDRDLFSGSIVHGIGHLTSFFPERLMRDGDDFRVEGIRCYWREGELFFKYGDLDCDEIYGQYHDGLEEDCPSTGSETFIIYPNPTDGVVFVQTVHAPSLPTQTYRIANLMGQTILTGSLNAETQQIDVSDLPQGMYFISIGDMTQKFVVR